MIPQTSSIPPRNSTEPSVARAFDTVAGRFDTAFENRITQRLREQLYELINAHVPRGGRILDLNCGTGIDALRLARDGYDVTGIDISRSMLAQAAEKARLANLSNVRFVESSFHDLSNVAGGPFDLAYSNFGGINCSDRLEAIAAALSPLCRPHAMFIAVVMPKFCLWETAAGLVRGNTQFAFRRLQSAADATGFGAETFPVFYHPLHRLHRAFAPAFQLARVIGLSVVSPPPHAMTFEKRFPRLSRMLQQADRMLSRVPCVRVLGDHYVAVFRRIVPPQNL